VTNDSCRQDVTVLVTAHPSRPANVRGCYLTLQYWWPLCTASLSMWTF